MQTPSYCACLNAGNKPSDTVANRYNHPEIKTALEKETHEKCAYCESKIKHISYGDIEHILPKNRDARPDLYVEWANLTLSCEQCNRSGKRTYYNPKLSLVNPYTDAPEDFLHDIGPLVMPIPGNDRAIVTEKVLKLNRSTLVERRTERIMMVDSSIPEIIYSAISPIIGVYSLNLGLEGFKDFPIPLWQRVLLVAGALALIVPGIVTDLIGLLIVAFVIFNQKRLGKKVIA